MAVVYIHIRTSSCLRPATILLGSFLLCCSKYWKRGSKVQTYTLTKFAVVNVCCVNYLPNVDSFLVIVQNLELASPHMLNLCTKYLIRMFDYTPCPPLLIISPMLFSIEQQNIYQPEP